VSSRGFPGSRFSLLVSLLGVWTCARIEARREQIGSSVRVGWLSNQADWWSGRTLSVELAQRKGERRQQYGRKSGGMLRIIVSNSLTSFVTSSWSYGPVSLHLCIMVLLRFEILYIHSLIFLILSRSSSREDLADRSKLLADRLYQIPTNSRIWWGKLRWIPLMRNKHGRQTKKS